MNCGDIMGKKFFATITVSILLATAAPIKAQNYKSSSYFYSDFFKNKPSDCKTFYPVPIGAVPGHKAPDDVCIPPPLTIVPKYGKKYAQLMRRGIQAGIRGDYDTALANFRRAELIEISNNYLGYTNREALRGINGALIAKRYRQNPHPNKRLTPQFFWYHWTGTGKRGNWGRNFNKY